MAKVRVPGAFYVPGLSGEKFVEATWRQNQGERFCLESSSDSSAPLVSLPQGRDDSTIRGRGKVNILPIMSHGTGILI